MKALSYARSLLIKRSSYLIIQRNMSLIRDKAFVNGEWVTSSKGKTFDVVNPTDGSIIGQVPDMDVEDTNAAIQSAYDAFKPWASTTAKERSNFLRKWFNLLEDNKEELARIVSIEAGKPFKESLGEVFYGNSFIEWFSEEARRIMGEIAASPAKSKEMLFVRQPIGVAALITPWNFPHAMITRKAGAALAAGCTCVIKPAEDTPLTALALAKLAHDAGIPNGVINVITSSRENAAALGKLLCESPLVRGLSFTGSTGVGKLLYQQCATGIKRVSLELGGNAPFIVFKSADLDKAVAGAMASKFRNCGQTCVSANRFLIEEPIFDDFVEKLKATMKNELKLGKDESCNTGPLINISQLNRVDSIVQDAVKKGARVHLGGGPAKDLGERWYQPTLITDVKPDMVCYKEEIFGPVVACIKFKSEDEALKIANDTPVGLAGYFYSGDISQCWRVGKALEVGMVGINEGMISCTEAAFGGVKESGIGREGSHHGIEEYTDVKYLCFGNL
ncbi:Succinate-semialdehyde dehydrogenase, mitochondrial [Frankliniella fusca]|uniref:Succinate-semialdehyde dehydrogenase, mitochondrial n=1 Tax=Frankliniella fusca TaxID=407009 RepID=A0AAE1LAS4_9NEOP|nr:Succinate-semialdehyde dehydrogenase, mitochondrial [Frankliniella fusca]